MLPSLLRPPREVKKLFDGVGARAEPGAVNARHAGEVVAITARRRQRPDELVAQHLLAARARLHVHHRRLAGDGDRLLHAADAHLGVDRRDAAAAHLDALSRRPSRIPAA